METIYHYDIAIKRHQVPRRILEASQHKTNDYVISGNFKMDTLIKLDLKALNAFS